MQLSTKYGFVFLCTPKCASTSIENALLDISDISFTGNPTLKHINARVYQRRFLPMYQSLLPNSNLESFCVIRDPIEWLGSWYRYRSRKQLSDPNRPNHKNYTGNMTFSEFVEAYLQPSQSRPPYARVGSIYDFVRDNNNEVGVDRIFSVENLKELQNYLKIKTGKDINIPINNVSKKTELFLEGDLDVRLRSYMERDLLLHKFIKNNGSYNRDIHRENVRALLNN